MATAENDRRSRAHSAVRLRLRAGYSPPALAWSWLLAREPLRLDDSGERLAAVGQLTPGGADALRRLFRLVRRFQLAAILPPKRRAPLHLPSAVLAGGSAGPRSSAFAESRGLGLRPRGWASKGALRGRGEKHGPLVRELPRLSGAGDAPVRRAPWIQVQRHFLYRG